MTDEPRYTYAEWVEQEMKRACAADGHRPYTWFMESSSLIPVSGICECHRVTWKSISVTPDD